MKRLLVICLLGICIGCSTDDVPVFFFEIVPVESVTNIPEQFTVNEADTLQISYFRPSTCHGFDGFEVEKNNNSRNIALVTKVVEDRAPCSDLESDQRTAPLIFKPEEAGTVILNFFQGNDANDNPTFLTFEVPIVE